MSPDAPPEGHQNLEAAGGDKPGNINVRLNEEEPDPDAAPGETVEEIVQDLKRERGKKS